MKWAPNLTSINTTPNGMFVTKKEQLNGVDYAENMKVDIL
jgi:hypothetical protein